MKVCHNLINSLNSAYQIDKCNGTKWTKSVEGVRVTQLKKSGLEPVRPRMLSYKEYKSHISGVKKSHERDPGSNFSELP